MGIVGLRSQVPLHKNNDNAEGKSRLEQQMLVEENDNDTRSTGASSRVAFM